jgi:sterol desaturase/sphingolipid hydroxylase (fatty acid hydroxylase superfamily)
MPPLPGFGLVCFLMALFYPLMGTSSFIFMAGFINGWALYVSIHYMIHAYQPISPFKILWTHHAKHHYKQGNKAFGVSSPFWDRVFGTMPN